MDEICSGYDEEISQLEQLQYMLMNIRSDSITEIICFIQNYFTNTTEKRRQLAYHILLPVKFHSESFPHIIQLILNLLDSLYELPRYLLSAISQEISSDNIIPYQNSIQAFLYKCYETNIFEITDIINLLKTCHDHFSLFNESICSLFCWFAPEIENEDSTFFSDCYEAFYFHLQYTEFKSAYQIILDNFESLRENNWHLYKQFRDSKDSLNPIYQAIRSDDVDRLKEIIFNTNKEFNSNINDSEFDVDKQYEMSPFEPSWIMRFKPTGIQIAAFFGSIRCFKFYMLNKANPLKKAGCNGCFGGLNGDYGMPLTYFAIGGGNAEIIHLTEQLGCRFLSDVLFSSVVFHRYQVFEWLIGTKQCDHKARDANGDSILHLAVLSDNVKVLKYLREIDNLDNEVDEFQISLLHYAAKYGNLAVLDFMLNNNYNQFEEEEDNERKNILAKSFDVNAKDDEKMTPLHYAVKYRRYETALVLLCHPKIDANAKNLNGWTPLHFAVNSKNEEMVKLLLEKSRADPNAKNNSLVSPSLMAAQMHLDDIKKLFVLTSSLRPQTTPNVLRKRPLTGFSRNAGNINNNSGFNIQHNDNSAARNRYGSTSALLIDRKCRPSTTIRSTRKAGRISSSKSEITNAPNNIIHEPRETIVRFDLNQRQREKPQLRFPVQKQQKIFKKLQDVNEKRISQTASGSRKSISKFPASNLSRATWKMPNIID